MSLRIIPLKTPLFPPKPAGSKPRALPEPAREQAPWILFNFFLFPERKKKKIIKGSRGSPLAGFGAEPQVFACIYLQM
jgi:hypothetical protein